MKKVFAMIIGLMELVVEGNNVAEDLGMNHSLS
ncbi:hypothetical protein JOC93_002987 [Priestia taiwanensis]|nr:hypothetical protein [Priestia taiwanensis]